MNRHPRYSTEWWVWLGLDTAAVVIVALELFALGFLFAEHL